MPEIHTHTDVQTRLAHSRLQIHLLGRWTERDALKSVCMQTRRRTDTGSETSSLSHMDRHYRIRNVCETTIKGQVCEAGTVVTRF